MRTALLIRHGESEHHVTGMMGGWTDLPLTQAGRHQVRRVADRLARMQDTTDSVVYASNLSRAAESGAIIAEVLACELRLEPGLREISNGQGNNLTVEQAEAIQLPRTQPIADWVAYPGAESWREMVKRVFECMDRIEHEGPPVAIIVGHGGSLAAAVRWWVGPSASSSRMWEFSFDAASLTALNTNHWDERQVGRLNDISHLIAG